MKSVPHQLVTIICEPILAKPMITLIRSLGASGFTMTEVQGEGSGNRHSGEIPDLKTKIEVLASSAVAQTVMQKVAEQFFEDYSVIVYATGATVLRAEKF
jgi:hypothetical protein